MLIHRVVLGRRSWRSQSLGLSGGNGTDLALEEGDDLNLEGGLGIEELNVEFDHLLQLIGL